MPAVPVAAPAVAPAAAPATTRGSKRPPLLVLRARFAYAARSPREVSIHPGDFFHVLQPQPHPAWYPVCNPVTGAQGLAPTYIFEVLSSSVNKNAQSQDQVQGQAVIGPCAAPARRQPHSPDTFLGQAQYDFTPSAPDQLGLRHGAKVHVCAYATAEWLFVLRLDSGGEMGLVPVSCIALLDPRTFKQLGNKPADLLAIGVIPSIEDYNRRHGSAQLRSQSAAAAYPEASGSAAQPPSRFSSSSIDAATALGYGTSTRRMLPSDASSKDTPQSSYQFQRTRSISLSHHKTTSIPSQGKRQRKLSIKSKSTAGVAIISPPLNNPALISSQGAVTRIGAVSPPPSHAARDRTQSHSSPLRHLVEASTFMRTIKPGTSSSPAPALPRSAALPMPQPVPTSKPQIERRAETTPAARHAPAPAVPSHSSSPAPSPVPDKSQLERVRPLHGCLAGDELTPHAPALISGEWDCPSLPKGRPTRAQVDAVHKSQGSYWYRIRALWTASTQEEAPFELELYRQYDDFALFHSNMQTCLASQQLGHGHSNAHTRYPSLPAPAMPSDSAARTLQIALDSYTRTVVGLSATLPCELARSLFNPQPGDRAARISPPGQTRRHQGLNAGLASTPSRQGCTGEDVDYEARSSCYDPTGSPTYLEAQSVQGRTHPEEAGVVCFSSTKVLPTVKTHVTEDLTGDIEEMSLSGSGKSTTSMSTNRAGDGLFGCHPDSHTAPTTPSSFEARPAPATVSAGRMTKIKVYHAATDELIAIRLDPMTTTHEQLLSKVRERLDNQIEVLRYPEALGENDAAIAAAAAHAEATPGEKPPALAVSASKIVMARLGDDEDVRDWLDQSVGRPTLYAAKQ